MSSRVILKRIIPQGFDIDAVAYFNACAAAGTPVTSDYKPRYNAVIKYLKKYNEWNNLDCLYIDATGNKAWALIDIRTPTRTQIKNNTYAGEFTADQGWVGNSSFSIDTAFNPTVGTNKFTRDDASYGILLVTNAADSTKHDVSCCDAGFTLGCFINSHDVVSKSICINSVIGPAVSYNKYIFSNYQWVGANRTAAAVATTYVNGVKQAIQVSASSALVNQTFGRMGARNTTGWVAGFYSANIQGCFYAGNGSVSQINIINAVNQMLQYSNTASYINKRVIFEVDSMTGSVAFASLSTNSAYPKAVMTTLGNGWSGVITSEASETILQQVTNLATEVIPYRNYGLQKDIVVLFGGTNDLATNRTAAQLYADIVTCGTALKNAGFKVIIVGIPDRDAGFSGGQTQAGFDTARASFRTLMNTDFNVATSVANTFGPASGIAYADYNIDIFADSKFTNASDLTYFMADMIHINSTADSVLANTYVAPTILLL